MLQQCIDRKLFIISYDFNLNNLLGGLIVPYWWFVEIGLKYPFTESKGHSHFTDVFVIVTVVSSSLRRLTSPLFESLRRLVGPPWNAQLAYGLSKRE